MRVAQAFLGIDVVLSVIAFTAYYFDKRAARHGRWRIEERTLHILALFGGWPGALLAQQRFRHKTRKQSFQLTFWITVVLNVALTLAVVASGVR